MTGRWRVWRPGPGANRQAPCGPPAPRHRVGSGRPTRPSSDRRRARGGSGPPPVARRVRSLAPATRPCCDIAATNASTLGAQSSRHDNDPANSAGANGSTPSTRTSRAVNTHRPGHISVVNHALGHGPTTDPNIPGRQLDSWRDQAGPMDNGSLPPVRHHRPIRRGDGRRRMRLRARMLVQEAGPQHLPLGVPLRPSRMRANTQLTLGDRASFARPGTFRTGHERASPGGAWRFLSVLARAFAMDQA
jgi:hypothetical protein